MTRRRVSFGACFAALLLQSMPAAVALDGHWQPPGVVPTTMPLTTVLARVDVHRGNVDGSYVAHFSVTAAGRTLSSSVVVRGRNVRYTTQIDGAAYGSGRSNGTRWRQTPAGLVHSLQSDLQGDALDRWPVSGLPIDAKDCVMLGETRGAQPQWVIQDAPQGDALVR